MKKEVSEVKENEKRSSSTEIPARVDLAIRDRYRFFDLVATPMGNNKTLIHSRRTGGSTLISAGEANFLLSCGTFKTLHAHAEEYARQLKWGQLNNRRGLRHAVLQPLLHYVTREGLELPVREKEVNPLLWQLRQWICEGFLVPESELLNEIKQNSVGAHRNVKYKPETDKITVMGIPTCNRPAVLKRCLSSFIDHFNRHGREPDIIIIDDSRDGKQQEKNRQVLQELSRRDGSPKDQYSGNFYYMNRKQRRALARTIAYRADVEPEVMEFALMGHPACNRSEGGCRNTFLLVTRGQLALQTDDDTICQVAQPPSVQPGLRLASQATSDDYWFFESYEEAAESVEFIDEDFLGIHEQMLVKRPEELIAPFLNKTKDDLDIETLQPSFLQNMDSDKARIRMSLVGPVGDTCLFTDLYRLFLEGESFQRLLYPAEDYSWHLTTRQVIRGVTQPTVTDAIRCIGMNFAVDNQDFLPPFMPVNARGDGIFGDLLNVCFPYAYSGCTPFLLAHKPPATRSRTVDKVFSLLELIRANDVVAQLIHSSQSWLCSNDPKENLRDLGRFLINLGSCSQDDFQDRIYRIYSSETGRQIQMAEQLLSRRNKNPAYWISHMRRYIEALRNSLLNNDFLNPAEMDNSSSPESIHSKNDRKSFQEIISLFGRLLCSWPDIYEATGDFDQDELLHYMSPP